MHDAMAVQQGHEQWAMAAMISIWFEEVCSDLRPILKVGGAGS